MDAETQRYVDKSMETVKAQNDARFSEVLSAISRVDDRVSHLPVPMTWMQMAIVVFAGIGTVFAVLAFASDRFDGGIAAYGLLDEFSRTQEVRDAAQDAKSDEMLILLKDLASRPAQAAP